MRGPVLKGRQVKLGNEVFEAFADERGANGAEAEAIDDGREPVVRFDQDGEVIKGIHITCSCGREMDLECVYDTEQEEGAAPDAADPISPAAAPDA